MSELDGPVALSKAELGFLRFVSSMTAEEESPLAALALPSRAEETRAGREALIERGLVEARSLRPDRELVRRLLVVCEPDARVRLVSLRSHEETILVDAFERAGAHVQLERAGDGLSFAPAEDETELRDRIRKQLPVRGSTGDFVRLELDREAYLAFSLLAARSAYERLRPDSEALLTQRLGGGLRALMEMDLAFERDGTPMLRPFLEDLGRALATKSRLHLVRTDFGAEEWLTRDVTFISVPGSLFQLHVTPTRGVMIAELDAPSLERALADTLEPPLREEESLLTA